MNKSETLIFCSLFVISCLFIASTRILRLENRYAIVAKSDSSVFIQNRMSSKDFSELLVSRNLIKDAPTFVWVASLAGYHQVQPGHYLVKKGHYKVKELISKFGLGHQDAIRLTVLPGLDLDRISTQISEQMRFSKEDFDAFLKDSTALSALHLDTVSVIGHLIPETYSIFWTSSPRQVVQMMQNLLDKTFEAQTQPYPLNLSKEQVVTLASIVQWEATFDDEKPFIAGLYLNRIRKRWPLQADPTVNFAIGERRRLTYADYQFKHPYNTYLYRGLPPGPITNPDLKSIEAVLNPENHKFMYMVATPEGKHDFSITLDEHQKKSERWVKWLREQRRQKRLNEEAQRG